MAETPSDGKFKPACLAVMALSVVAILAQDHCWHSAPPIVRRILIVPFFLTIAAESGYLAFMGLRDGDLTVGRRRQLTVRKHQNPTQFWFFIFVAGTVAIGSVIVAIAFPFVR